MKVLGERNIQTSESRKPVTLMGVILRSLGNSVMSVMTQVFWKHK